MSKNDTSRFIALILRHKPEVIGITLDEHGSAVKYEQSIDDQGLISKTRLYVHLSKDYDTAVKVGSRHGKPVIYKVLSGKMDEDGFDFFLSKNNVWLTDHVPVDYLVKIKGEK